jgi:hypothetical protein
MKNVINHVTKRKGLFVLTVLQIPVHSQVLCGVGPVETSWWMILAEHHYSPPD